MTQRRARVGSSGGKPALWPRDVRLIVSALEAAPRSGHDRRQYPRVRHHVTAELELFAEQEPDRRLLYVRDAGARGVGFVTAHRLPLGYGGQLYLPDPLGRMLLIDCTIHRCREAVPGWYEGALAFNREQFCFLPEADTGRGAGRPH